MLSLSKYNVVSVPKVMPYWIEEDAFLGVARISAITAERMLAAAVCEIEFWFAFKPTGSNPNTATRQNAVTPRATVTSTSENEWEAQESRFTVDRF